MAVENITSAALLFPQELIQQVGWLILVLQTLGGVIIFYLLFSVVNAILNKKRNKKIDEVLSEVSKINQNLREIRRILYRK